MLSEKMLSENGPALRLFGQGMAADAPAFAACLRHALPADGGKMPKSGGSRSRALPAARGEKPGAGDGGRPGAGSAKATAGAACARKDGLGVEGEPNAE